VVPLPTRFVASIVAFAPLFRQPRTWQHAQQLLVGAMLAPGVRTVASVLRVLGLARERRFCTYHRVLSRAVWSPLAGARILLGLLVRTFVPAGPLVFGLDDTIERRWGKQIRARGIYRDPVRSSDAHFVKASGLRWLSVMLLAEVPWAGRVWALPVLTLLAPSERATATAGRRYKTLVAWARQAMRQLARWCAALAPGRPLILVADLSFAAHPLLLTLAPLMTCITRLRLDGRLFAPAPPMAPARGRRTGRRRVKGARLPLLRDVLADPATAWGRTTIAGWYGATARAVDLATGTAVWYQNGRPVLPLRWVLVRDPEGRFDPQALLCTDLALTPAEIVGYYVRRWQVEVTFAEVRRHLGVETQRQWSDRAIARTTPVLLGLFSLVTLLATQLARGGRLPVRQAAWYRKPAPTFSDALAAVRRHWWRAAASFRRPRAHRRQQQVPRALFRRLYDAVCYAAA
jgi:hypothetical protein